MHLLLVMLKTYQQQGFVTSTTHGQWDVHCAGTVRCHSGVSQLTRVEISTLPFNIAFKLDSGEMVTIWRDSCADEQYRQLTLVLRQWKSKQEAEAPC